MVIRRWWQNLYNPPQGSPQQGAEGEENPPQGAPPQQERPEPRQQEEERPVQQEPPQHPEEQRPVNPEGEEKPFAPATSLTSEDTHGGNEQSDSNAGALPSVLGREQEEEVQQQEVDGRRERADRRQVVQQGVQLRAQWGDVGGPWAAHAVELYAESGARSLATTFQRFIERIAEVETKVEVPDGSERLSMRLLIRRAADRRPLRSCYAGRLKERVVLIVDTSGSMYWWGEVLRKMTTLAMKFKDIEIYVAPNGVVDMRVTGELMVTDEGELAAAGEPVDHKQFMARTRNRVIIYIGDFDGGDTPFELARHNKVYWLCNERRYRDTSEHDWCSHRLDEYPRTCKIFFVYSEEDLVKVFVNKAKPYPASRPKTV